MRLFILYVLLFISLSSYAQKQTDFTLPVPTEKIKGSLYNAVLLLDERDDTTTVGTVQTGALNRLQKVVPAVPLHVQLDSLIKKVSDNAAGSGKLVLVLKQFYLQELSGAANERGFINIKAFLFTDASGVYSRVATADTVLIIKAFDVTKKLLKTGGEVLAGFITNNLKVAASGNEKFTMANLLNTDSIIKSSIPLYSRAAYTDGFYKKYVSFKNQQPDELNFIVKEKEGNLKSVSTVNAKGKYDERAPENLYAVVYHGIPYIATPYGYYHLEKEKADFIFTGRYRTASKGGPLPVIIFGIAGVMMTSSYVTVRGKAKLDYVSGEFIPITEK